MPLRIWMISQSYLPYQGGITEHVWHLSAALAARGHHVTVVTGRPLDIQSGDDPDPPGVRILRTGLTVRVPSHGSRACITLPNLRFGPPLTSAPSTGPTGLPDIVHLQSPLEPFLPLWALQHLPGIKVGTFHTGGARPHWGYRWGARWLRAYAERLDARIAVSSEAARFVRAHLPGDYVVVPNGIELIRFNAASGASASRPPDTSKTSGRDPIVRDEATRSHPTWDGALRALYVGRLDPRKGLPVLLDALDRYRAESAGSRLPPVTLDIVGDGPLAGRLKSFARRRRLAVNFWGRVSREELTGHYRRSDLCIALSEHGESFGINILEAMASGRPVIVSNIDGYRETVAGSGAGLLVEAGSEPACTQALVRLATDPALREAMGRAGRRHAQGYSWAAIAERIERVYRGLLEGNAVKRRSRKLRCTSPGSAY